MEIKEKKMSSFSTILALYNNMLGGGLLTLPILFRDSGLISSIIVLLLSAFISFATCRIYVMHTKDNQKNVQESIGRILGKKGEQMFQLITGVYIVFLNFVYMDLIVDQLYSIIFYFCDLTDSSDSIAPKDKIVFDKFSLQYLTLILVLPLFAYISIKKLNFLVRISEYGSYSIFLYMVYLIVRFFVALFKGQIDLDNVTWFSTDLGSLAGTCSLAFSIHAFVVPFMKQNKNQDKNMRDLGVTYVIGFITYFLAGVLGALTVAGKDCKNTFVDCYLSEWTILIVEISYFINVVSTFPSNISVGRTRVLQLIFGEVSNKNFTIFTIIFMVVATMFSILSPKIPLSTLMGLVGAFICYFFIYLFPTIMHYKCLYKSKKKDQTLLSESMLQGEEKEESNECNHSPDYVKKKPRVVRYGLYGVLNLIGVGFGILGVYQSVQDIINN